MQKLKSYLMSAQSLKVLPLKPGVGQYTAMHATLTARDFFLANFYPSGPFTCIFFPKPLPSFVVFCVCFFFSPVVAVASTSSCVGLQNKIGTLLMQIPVLSARGM